MSTLLAFAVAAAITFMLRAAMTLVGDRSSAESPLNQAIGLVSPAVLTAIVASTLLLDQGQLIRPHVVEVFAVIAAIVAVRRTRNVSAALAVGLPVYWVGVLVGLA
jgi:branched-subunit amino acid transport protein